MSRIPALFAAVAAAALVAGSATAALKEGAKAPMFSAPGYEGGKPLKFDLAAALKKGPVVLYFFPAAETTGCNLEAHLFAQSIDKFHDAGATVIGVTAGNLDKLAAFSKETEHCAGKFPVAADPNAVIAKRYDASLSVWPGHSDRTSYVIAPDDKVIFAYSDLKANEHVDKTLAALSAWRTAHPH
ncbi:MAG TPA: peroxiredoxin [Caulobacteraceae bacterium]|nr:peroxiredoxin [Caulobacteraceae bacterium]